jgi:hypothetical protein
MGNGGSKLEKALAECPDDERYYGFENFGNTCYANSVLQALYFCRPFRERVQQYCAALPKDAEENMLNCLADLFQQVGGKGEWLHSGQREHACVGVKATVECAPPPTQTSRRTQNQPPQIQTAKKRTGVIAPKRFVQRLKRDNEAFRSYMHQDAHEFLNYLLNVTSELLEGQARGRGEPTPSTTWVTDIFQVGGGAGARWGVEEDGQRACSFGERRAQHATRLVGRPPSRAAALTSARVPPPPLQPPRAAWSTRRAACSARPSPAARRCSWTWGWRSRTTPRSRRACGSSGALEVSIRALRGLSVCRAVWQQRQPKPGRPLAMGPQLPPRLVQM